MNLRFFAFALLAAGAVSTDAAGAESAAESAPVPATSVRLATFNVYNYLSMDRRVEGRFRPAYPKPEAEKDGVRRAIREVAPDVLALQEMGPAPYLEELRQDLALEGTVYRHGYVLEGADPERHVAVLSRLPFTRVVPHPEVSFNYFDEREAVKRGMLEVRFGDEADGWTLFVVHLKSRYTDRPDDPASERRRTLEARALRDLVLERFPEPSTARFVIAGDFNDTPRSRPLAAFRERGERTIALVLPASDSRGDTWTHRYLPEESYTRVDFLLVSPGMHERVVDGRAFVHDGVGTLEGSDHRLVYADLRF
jgi:endonuclease/exonuclease/phosphatase family metal-dependent hydrolase